MMVVMKDRMMFTETDRLVREALHDYHETVMVMCEACGRSVPEGVPCMVCEQPAHVPATGAETKDLDRPDCW